jgi:hypothetical protein
VIFRKGGKIAKSERIKCNGKSSSKSESLQVSRTHDPNNGEKF